MKNYFRKLLFYLAPPKCVCCNKRTDISDTVLCKECREVYNDTLRRNCSICAKPLYGCTCTNDYLDAHFIHKSVKVFRYLVDKDLPTNKLIFSLKKDNRHDVLDFLSSELSDAIRFNLKDADKYVITSVPRRRSAILKYGFDHAEKLARAVAKKLNAKYIKALKSDVKREQKLSSSREERFKDLKFNTRKKSIELQGRNVILIDDIVTTGASMGACAMLLKSVGVKKIIGASLAIAYKDSYEKFNTEDRFKKKKKI